MAPRTLTEKIWDAHVVHAAENEPDLLFIDLHLLHEVTSPQAFDGIRLAGRTVRRPDLTLATADHNVPPTDLHQPAAHPPPAGPPPPPPPPPPPSRWPTPSRPASSRCSRPTAPSSASPATPWAMPTRASS